MGMLGGGPGAFIGDTHRKAARICNAYTLEGGAFSADLAKSLQFAVSEGLAPNRIYADVDALVSGEMALPENRRMEAVSIVTPNNLHFQQAKILLENGFHVICDKPVTLTSAEAETPKGQTVCFVLRILIPVTPWYAKCANLLRRVWLEPFSVSTCSIIKVG